MDVSTKLFTWSSYNKQPAKSSGLFSLEFLRCHEFRLLGRTSTWFLPDIVFYNQNLSRKDIFSAIGWIPPAKTTEAIQENPDKAKVYAGHHTDIVVQNLLIVPGVLNLLTLPFIFLVPESMGNL
ncbi:SOLUTE CARRIER FAMILY 22 MEMBER [Salix viminalis]|uniref:SOLUTE CARRIER FAMILY 22 MEMBER n=1 Tax=Salix viminalis TaxID=40686 RepID=A0A9Q0UUA3_SALVM|nr:SOLUTE CARRIER FAMILY 22 MEMBER [Salix viminalis]